MPGPPPKVTRRRRNAPASGEWKPTAGIGWQHGPIPKPPAGLMPPTLAAWATWFGAWFASHWSAADLPGIRHVALLYDAVERGELQRAGEKRMAMDGYGITPKGQQMLHWAPPKPEEVQPSAEDDPYSRLRVVG
jgi:hypothetical protein